MNQPEMNPDEQIDRLLNGLRKAEPPLGMERRILQTVSGLAPTRRAWDLVPVKSWTFAVAGAIAVALTIAGIILRSHHAEPQNADTRRHDVPAALATRQPPVTALGRAPSRPLKRPAQAATKHRADAPETLPEEDALAFSEMNAPSLPAPPLPITEQEALLMRLIHKGDPIELAMLDPRLRSSEEAASRADFDRFFAPPPSTDKKLTNGDNK